jgi:hypothetical protein
MAEYLVVLPVNHDGLEYKTGENIELGDDSAAALLRVGCVVPLDVKKGKGSKQQVEE